MFSFESSKRNGGRRLLKERVSRRRPFPRERSCQSRSFQYRFGAIKRGIHNRRRQWARCQHTSHFTHQSLAGHAKCGTLITCSTCVRLSALHTSRPENGHKKNPKKSHMQSGCGGRAARTKPQRGVSVRNVDYHHTPSITSLRAPLSGGHRAASCRRGRGCTRQAAAAKAACMRAYSCAQWRTVGMTVGYDRREELTLRSPGRPLGHIWRNTGVGRTGWRRREPCRSAGIHGINL